MIGEALEELAFYHWVFEKLVAIPPLYHWLMQKATEQGMAQGEERGLREAVLIILRGRFGEPDADVVQAVDTASREMLSAILLNAATDTLAHVRERLGLSQDGQA